MSRDHRSLDAFKLADELALSVYIATADLGAVERFGLQNQLRRAAISVPANIVEGCARESEAELKRFLEIALGSAREVIYLMDLARRLGLIDPGEALKVTELGNRSAAAITALRRWFRSRPL